MIAFVFPGQGAQTPAMGAPWRDHPSWEVVEEAAALTGRDLPRLLCDADADELRATRNAQLATYVLSLVVLDAVERLGLDAPRKAGHSLGEYSALTAAGMLSLEDGLALVHERGEAMQTAADERDGTMAAVLGLGDDDVAVACAGVAGDVWVANHNAPGQIVVAGDPQAIERAGERARQLGAKRVMPLPVGGAFHTPFMASARDRLAGALDGVDFRDPDGLVVANVDGAPHPAGAEWPELLTAQLCSPVRWRHTVDLLVDDGVTAFVELGPGTALTGMVKRIAPRVARSSVAVPDDLDGLLESVSDPPATEWGPEPGEHLFVTERLVVTPGGGVFAEVDGVAPGDVLTPGSLVGMVGDHEVRSPFAGTLMGILAMPGERLTASAPVAWLRTS